jgi:CheY-like chemotaxis protein
MIAAFAADHGQTVIAAKTGVEAVAILDSGRVVDIVVADSTPPAMSGSKLIAHVPTRRLELAALLVSG